MKKNLYKGQENLVHIIKNKIELKLSNDQQVCINLINDNIGRIETILNKPVDVVKWIEETLDNKERAELYQLFIEVEI